MQLAFLLLVLFIVVLAIAAFVFPPSKLVKMLEKKDKSKQ